MSGGLLPEIRADDLKLVCRALCHADGQVGAPCRCDGTPATCSAVDVYGDQARAVLVTLEAQGRLAGQTVRLTPQLVESFFEQRAAQRRANPFEHGCDPALHEGLTYEDVEAYLAFQAGAAT